MALNEKAAKAVRRRQALLDAGLTLLLHRAGGRLEFTEADYQAVLRQSGGATRPNIQFEVLRAPGAPETVRLVLGQKAAANAELMS